MICTYLLSIAAAATIGLAFSNGCKMMALLNLFDEAQKDGLIPDRKAMSEIDKVFSILCYLLGVALTLFFFLKILYEKY